MSQRYAYVMMIKDVWWQEFCRLRHKGKEVQSYVQSGYAAPTNASLIFFYVTKPVAEVAGYAEFIERKVGNAKDLWEKYGHESVLSSKEKFFDFVKDARRVSFVRFKNLEKASKPIPLNNFLMLLGVKRLARGGFYVNKETAERMIAIMK
ncbi:MAG: hypothetical protein QW667_03325 [Candidatus Bathyarchaeia archaeon]